MGDGFTLWTFDPEIIDRVRKNKSLTFINKVSVDTGEVIPYPQKAWSRHIKFKIINSSRLGLYLEITGNIFMFYKRQCNSGDFRVAEMFEGFYELIKTYDLNPFTMRVISFELGINLEIDNTNDLIENIIAFKNKPHSQLNYKKRGFYKFYRLLGYYSLKFYNKGIYCNLNKDILRIELRGITSRFLRKHKISTLSDLLRENTLLSLKIFLLKQLSYVLLWPSNINLSNAPRSEEKLLSQFRVPKCWVDYKQGKPTGTYRKKKRIEFLFKKYSGIIPIQVLIEKSKAKMEELWLNNEERETYSFKYKSLSNLFN